MEAATVLGPRSRATPAHHNDYQTRTFPSYCQYCEHGHCKSICLGCMQTHAPPQCKKQRCQPCCKQSTTPPLCTVHHKQEPKAKREDNNSEQLDPQQSNPSHPSPSKQEPNAKEQGGKQAQTGVSSLVFDTNPFSPQVAPTSPPLRGTPRARGQPLSVRRRKRIRFLFAR